ncbi:hypothetical protein H0H92_012181 [Tricholoma furcatifolium]|nr:hypothetical protein H0H92_012181 [Tricholoma furcatifolium]
MSSTESFCIPSNPDISGIGVRTAVYAQNLLSIWPAAWALHDGKVTPMELECIETQSTTVLVTAFALLVSAVIQASRAGGISNYHATLVLNLSWMNNTNLFIYILLYVASRFNGGKEEEEDAEEDDADALSSKSLVWRILSEAKRACKNPVIIIGSLHLSLMAIVGTWLWSRPVKFGSSSPCSLSVTLSIIGKDVPLGSEGLRIWSILAYSILLVPLLNLILPIAFLSLPLFLRYWWAKEWNVVKFSMGLDVLCLIDILLVINTEVTIKKNSKRPGFLGAGEKDWTFGQTLALLLLLLPLRDLGESIMEKRAASLGKRLVKSSEKGETDVVRYLLGAGAKSNSLDPSLRIAAEKGYAEIVRLLITRGADVNNKDSSNVTPLHLAAKNGHLDAVQLLVDNKATLNIQTTLFSFPLHDAVEGGNLYVVRYLVEHNADVDPPSVFGATPLFLAARWGHFEIAKFLVEHGADVNARGPGDFDIPNILRAAADDGYLDIVELLIKQERNPTEREKRWKSVLEIAIKRGYGQMQTRAQDEIAAHNPTAQSQ